MAEVKPTKRTFIMPTAINVLNLVNENIITNLLRKQDSALEIPSLFRLAFMVHNNTGELPVTKGDYEEEDTE
jgi:hypothetical protein